MNCSSWPCGKGVRLQNRRAKVLFLGWVREIIPPGQGTLYICLSSHQEYRLVLKLVREINLGQDDILFRGVEVYIQSLYDTEIGNKYWSYEPLGQS